MIISRHGFSNGRAALGSCPGSVCVAGTILQTRGVALPVSCELRAILAQRCESDQMQIIAWYAQRIVKAGTVFGEVSKGMAWLFLRQAPYLRTLDLTVFLSLKVLNKSVSEECFARVSNKNVSRCVLQHCATRGSLKSGLRRVS